MLTFKKAPDIGLRYRLEGLEEYESHQMSQRYQGPCMFNPVREIQAG